MTHPHIYSLYGLYVQADTELPGLVPVAAPTRVDLQVQLASNGDDDALDGVPWVPGGRFRDRLGLVGDRISVDETADGDWIRVRFAGGLTFVLSGAGTSVLVRLGTMSREVASAFLVNNILGLCLRLRRQPVLHGAAVALGDNAIVISGPSGAGKSTLTYGFVAAGAAVLTDDVCALDGGRVWPGPQRVRLWPQTVEALLDSPEAIPATAPEVTKRTLDLAEEARTESVSIAALVFLDGYSERCVLEPLDRPRSTMLLVENAYLAHWIGSEMRGNDFGSLSALADGVRAFRFRRPKDHDRLDESVRALWPLFDG